MKFTKKGQAALEFLTTYGWAFLVILVMIGALGYFGVLSPQNFLPQRCSVGPEFTCDDYQATSSGPGGDVNVSAVLKNNLGEAMDVDATDFSAVSGTLKMNCTTSKTRISAGEGLTLSCEKGGSSADLVAPIGSKVKFLIQGKYKPIGKTFYKPITVEVYATLQPSS